MPIAGLSNKTMLANNGGLKVAIVSLSLGNVSTTRGLEVWAQNLAYELKNKSIDVTLYKGWGKVNSSIEKVLGSLKRDSMLAKNLNRFLPSFSWRFNLGSTGAIEGTTFAINLIKEVIKEKFDIVHTGDAPVANVLINAKRLGLIKSKIIFANAVPDEPIEFITKFKYVQHRTPYQLEETKKQVVNIDTWFAIPNFVDTEIFKPKVKTEARKALGIAEDNFVVLCAASVDKYYKRVDYLINETADFFSRITNIKPLLIIVGAERKETKELMQMGRELLNDKIKILLNQPHEKMPQIYNAADVFVMCSLNEVFGIAFIEAMSCGIPAIGHIYPPTKWVIGSGGDCVDMLQPKSLSFALEKYLNKDYCIRKGRCARQEVLDRFLKDRVTEQIIQMYKKVMES